MQCCQLYIFGIHNSLHVIWYSDSWNYMSYQFFFWTFKSRFHHNVWRHWFHVLLSCFLTSNAHAATPFCQLVAYFKVKYRQKPFLAFSKKPNHFTVLFSDFFAEIVYDTYFTCIPIFIAYLSFQPHYSNQRMVASGWFLGFWRRTQFAIRLGSCRWPRWKDILRQVSSHSQTS